MGLEDARDRHVIGGFAGSNAEQGGSALADVGQRMMVAGLFECEAFSLAQHQHPLAA